MPSKEKKYNGEKFSFAIDEEIGQGGNGIVYSINCDEPKINKKMVAKFFCTGSNKEKRYERFKNEVKTVLSLQDSIPGVMKIVDYHCPEQLSEDDEAFYIMQRAGKYFPKSFEQILYDFHGLANTLAQIHNNGYAHRDIKPDNILFLHNKPLLSDFGLVWDMNMDNGERISCEDEPVGPRYIRPPELDNIDLDEIIEYPKSDIYLLAKCLWIFLRRDRLGFRGPYNRDGFEYLERSKFGVKTLEPIHRLMEKATKHDFFERCDIEYFIEQLELELMIIKQECPKEVENDLLLDEITKEFRISNKPSVVKYDKKMAFSLLNKILPIQPILIMNIFNNAEFDVMEPGGRLQYYDDYCSAIYRINNSIVKRYDFCINELEYRDDKIIITLNNIDTSKYEVDGTYPNVQKIGKDSILVLNCLDA